MPKEVLRHDFTYRLMFSEAQLTRYLLGLIKKQANIAAFALSLLQDGWGLRAVRHHVILGLL